MSARAKSRGVAAGGTAAPGAAGLVVVVGGRIVAAAIAACERREADPPRCAPVRYRRRAAAVPAGRARRRRCARECPVRSPRSERPRRPMLRNASKFCCSFAVSCLSFGSCRKQQQDWCQLRRAARSAHVLLVLPDVLQPSSQVIRDLARRQGASFVSCYVPFARSGHDVRQNAIHLKHCQRAIATAADATLRRADDRHRDPRARERRTPARPSDARPWSRCSIRRDELRCARRPRRR